MKWSKVVALWSAMDMCYVCVNFFSQGVPVAKVQGSRCGAVFQDSQSKKIT